MEIKVKADIEEKEGLISLSGCMETIRAINCHQNLSWLHSGHL
jgi:hypothetical protein